MHQQIRTKPTASPPDLERLLRTLSEDGVNIAAAGGGNLELGGEFAFTVWHKDGDDAPLEAARESLRRGGYEFYEVETDVCWMVDRPGELRRCVARISEKNLEAGRVIVDIAIGAPGPDKRIPVQIYSTEVRTSANTVAPPPWEEEAGETQTSEGA